MIKLTAEREIRRYVWAHPNDDESNSHYVKFVSLKANQKTNCRAILMVEIACKR